MGLAPVLMRRASEELRNIVSYPYNNAGGHPRDVRQAGLAGMSLPGASPHNQGHPASAQSTAGYGAPQRATGSSRGMQSIILVALAIPLCVLLIAIGGIAFIRSQGASPSSAPTAIKTVTAEQYSADIMNGKFHIESTSVTRGPLDQDGADTVLVTLAVTNNTDNAEFIMLHTPSLKQKGIGLGFAALNPDEYPDVIVEMNDDMVRPGDTVTITLGFKYINVGEPVIFMTDVPPEEDIFDFPHIIVQPS